MQTLQCQNRLSARQNIASSSRRTQTRTVAAPVMRAVVAGERPQEVFPALSRVELPAAVRPIVAAGVTNALLAAPALAEPGKIFDFNLTLPIMAGQFLILMVILDKLVYTPVGDVLDERNKGLKEKMDAVKDNSGELEKILAEAAAMIADARAEGQQEINAKKAEADAAADAKIAEAKAKLDKELAAAAVDLEKEKETLLATIDGESTKLASEIVEKLFPETIAA
eukprot:CAMPEP_0170161750 /NCGR_PEP_ID=MMETSP0033_2-20121228/76745_1 /TAXON_ID=195969 /ORGANISM="Dolichomastix tenuilepis, Strain CCMP3274" /LENGTH=224 /DNA_ID=CAMNT_0010399373 /DNA_START=688 /DNA_END=1362 /DNA_ORIENTATION=-